MFLILFLWEVEVKAENEFAEFIYIANKYELSK